MTFSQLRSDQHSRMRNPRIRMPMRTTLVELAAAAVVALATASVFATAVNAQTAPAANRPAGAAPAAAAPAGAGGATPTGAAAAPAASVGRQSFYADRREYVVGDIVTILIDDYTITTALKENVASDTRSGNKSIGVRLPASSKSIGLDSRNDASQNERGSAKRENRFQNEMSVRVIAVGENGMIQIKGTKNINVDKNVQDITLTGWARSQDISANNTIESARIADASIGYTSPGNLTKPKQGIISKIVGIVWP